MSAAPEPTPQPAAPPTSWQRLLWLALVGAAIPTVLAFFARFHWTLDLATHFPVQLAGASLVLLVLFALGREWKGVAAAAAVLAVNATHLAPSSREVAGANTKPFRVISANILTSNRDTQKFLDLVEREDPDVLLVMEVNVAWAVALAPLKERYPWQAVHPRSDNFGIAFYSRHPGRIEAIELGASEVPTIIARLDVNGDRITILGVHTLPPIGREYSNLRNEQLTELTRLAAAERDPLLVLGDLNATPWSPYFGDLLAASGLRDSRRGFGIQPTWPAGNPLLRIPIDHALVSKHIVVQDRRVGPGIGSDHFPLILDAAIRSGLPGE